MKRIGKIVLYIISVIVGISLILWLCFWYITNYKATTCDISVSPNEKYELMLQAVGEPDWPFGSASGRLVLKQGENKISQSDFELQNDGASISSSCWKVTWYEDYVEVVLSGREQSDEKLILYFNGKKEIF